MKALSTTVNGSAISVSLYAANVTPTLPARQVTVGQFPAYNPNFSRLIQVSDEYVFVKSGTYSVALALADLVNLALTQEPGLTWTPPVVYSQPTGTSTTTTVQASIVAVIGSEYTITYSWRELSNLAKSAATLTWSGSALAYSSTTYNGTATLTSNNTNVSNNDTVRIGEKTYTFKTTLTPTEGEVLIGADADASLLNLIRAINHTGTPDVDYKCAAAHPAVSAASSVTAHAFVITNKALTTTSIYDVATAGTLKITPTVTTNSGTYYYLVATDNASSPGSVATDRVALTVT